MFEKSLILFAGLLSHNLLTQNNLPKNYFRSPVDTVILLAGNFGELRPDHFHAGIDIKTGNKTGMPVHAAADGYVSRIKASSFGYGNVIYLTHPNGYVSVYGHLSAFDDSLGNYVKKQQYALRTFEIELFPKKDAFQVKQGDIIAFSGNTGNSAGPHLHFEIRNEKSEMPINPLLFGIPVKDSQKPRIISVKIYPADKAGLINGSNKAVEYSARLSGKEYEIVSKTPPGLSGNIYFGLEAFDTETSAGGNNGVYEMELRINDRCVYSHKMDSIGFDQSRTINSFIDYPEYLKSGKRIQRSYIEPDNKLSIYKNFRTKGIIHFNSDSSYFIKYTLKDFSGNTSVIEFRTKSSPAAKTMVTPVKPDSAQVFYWMKENNFHTDNFSISMPAKILYDDILFKYSVSKGTGARFSEIHHVQSADIPVHDFFRISIKAKKVKDSLKKHLFISRINKNGRKEFIGGVWSGDFISAKTTEFGDYMIASDTIAPVIQALNLVPGTSLEHQKTIAFKISDDFSGIAAYEGTIDGKWILMEYDYKQKKLYYKIDKDKLYSPFDPLKTMHLFCLKLSDRAGNTSNYSASFHYTLAELNK